MITGISLQPVSKAAVTALSKKKEKIIKKNYMTKKTKIKEVREEEEILHRKARALQTEITTDNEEELILSEEERKMQMEDCEEHYME